MRERGEVLVRWARASVSHALGGPEPERPQGVWCDEPGATFVTLRWQRSGQLQGCIGSLAPARAIVSDVAHNAVHAAMRDPRGEKFALHELDELDVELSILSALEPIAGEHEIRVGTDGIVLEYEAARATFLPVMWKVLIDIPTFMRELRKKAGLPRDIPSSELRLQRYTVEHYLDPAPRP